jgi:hypothetical protein
MGMTRLVLGWLLVAALPACAFVHDQVAVTSVNECINRDCGDEQGAARQQCQTECSQRYGR